MSDIERELREALQRRQPPAGFGQRVAERAERAQRNRQRRWQWIPTAVVAGLLMSVGGAYWQRQRQAEQTKDQLMQALQITGQKLTLVERAAGKNLDRQER
jgi:hypothetical protein